MEKIVKVKKTRRAAIPYIVNLVCDCGGRFEKVEPIEFYKELEGIKHVCNKCGMGIYSKDVYPTQSMFSDAEEEAVGFENVVTEKKGRPFVQWYRNRLTDNKEEISEDYSIKNYDPVAEAYKILCDVYHKKDGYMTLQEAEIAIGYAIGYLGEALK